MSRPANSTSIRSLGFALIGALAGAALLGCTLGGADEGQGSPYDDATLEVKSEGVADGVTPVEVVVTGQADARLTVEVAHGASFVQPDANTTNEKTVFLVDDDGDGIGTGSAFAISKTEGSAPVFFKVDPLFEPSDILFHRVRLAAMAKPSGFAPGQLEHKVCVAVNTSVGKISVTQVSVGTITAEAEVTTSAPAGLDCPPDEDGELPWAGYARLTWITPEDEALASVQYAGVDGEALLTDTLELSGAAFPGYEVSAADPVVNASFVSYEVTFAYADAGSLSGEPATGVSVVQRFIPVPTAEDFVLGSSSGGAGTAQDPMITAGDGKLTVFFNPSYPGTYAWFVTPQGGSPAQLSIVIPQPPAE